MPQAQTLRVLGYRELLRACDHAGPDTRKQVRTAIRHAGDTVRDDWSTEEERFGTFTATGLRTIVRARGVTVEQIRRRTTGLRPDFGRKQQLIGEATLATREKDVRHDLDVALDRVIDHFDH